MKSTATINNFILEKYHEFTKIYNESVFPVLEEFFEAVRPFPMTLDVDKGDLLNYVFEEFYGIPYDQLPEHIKDTKLIKFLSRDLVYCTNDALYKQCKSEVENTMDELSLTQTRNGYCVFLPFIPDEDDNGRIQFQPYELYQSWGRSLPKEDYRDMDAMLRSPRRYPLLMFYHTVGEKIDELSQFERREFTGATDDFLIPNNSNERYGNIKQAIDENDADVLIQQEVLNNFQILINCKNKLQALADEVGDMKWNLLNYVRDWTVWAREGFKTIQQDPYYTEDLENLASSIEGDFENETY